MTDENNNLLVSDQAITANALSSTYRVKLYQLNIDTNWEDKGTGFCVYQLGQDGEPDQIIVQSEEDDSILLNSQVTKRRFYQKQQETLIVWTEDDNRDLALSFQDPAGCDEIWQYIGKKQDGIMTGDMDNGDLSPPANSGPEMTSLPDPELSNLQEIADILIHARIQEKEKMASFISIENYIDKLLPLFETCEDLEDIKDLHLLYTVMIGILGLNDQGIIEQLVRDEYLFAFMGILEYNPKTPSMKANHREFIKTHSNTPQIIEFTEESIKHKVDQTFRLEYVQTIIQQQILPDSPPIDIEGLLSVLGNLIFQNHVEVVSHIQNNHSFLKELFGLMKTDKEKRCDIMRFVNQLCQLTKQMQNSIRVNLFRALAMFGLFDLLCFALADQDKTTRTTSLNLLASFTDLDVVSVRSHILMQSKEQDRELKPLIDVIVERFVVDGDYDLKVQYFEILRLLLDPNSGIPNNPNTASGNPNDPLNKQVPETDEFLQLFYDKHTTTLLKPVDIFDIKTMSLKGPIEPLLMTQDQAQLCLYICEFLYFAIRHHGFRSKYVVLSSDLIIKIAQLYRSKYAYIKLAALRFFRVCIALNDEFYNRNLVKHNVFEPTIRVLLDTDGRDCLLNSACLDLFEHIRKENIKSLLTHLVTQFGSVLDTITYVPTCKQLRMKYDENQRGAETSQTEGSSSSEHTDKKANHEGWVSATVDDDEEEYFNTSDEEETTSSEQIPKPLVSYEDDEDDEEEEEEEEEEDEEDEEEEEDGERTKDTQEPSSIEERPPLTRKRSSEEADLESIAFKSRKKSSEEEEEDDVLAKKRTSSPRQSVNKKIVINTANMKRMRSQ